MQETYKGLPLIKLTDIHFTGSALLSKEKPANEVGGILYSKQEPQSKHLYAVDATRRTILTCYARADYPVYRRDDKGNEWYELITAEEIAKGRVSFFKHHNDDNINIDHSDEFVGDDVTIVDSFILDEHHKLDYPEFAEIAPGSWMVGYYIHSDELLKRLTGANSLEAVSVAESNFAKKSKKNALLMLLLS